MKIFLTLLITIFAIQLQAVTLKWDIPKGKRLEMVRTAKVNYLINSKLYRIYDERNIIDLTCYKKKDTTSSVRGKFTVYHKEYENSIFTIREQHLADFDIYSNGRFKVPSKIYMPNVRHVPTFPNKSIEIGKKWTAKGDMIINTFSKPFKLTFDTYYELQAINNGIAEIKYFYKINQYVSKNFPRDFPTRIGARNKGIIYWDIKQNCPVNAKEEYRIVFVMGKNNGNKTLELITSINGDNRLYSPLSENDIDNAKNELRKALKKDKGIEVSTDDRGIVVRMGDLLFDFGSYNIKKETAKKLNTIARILKEKYPDREIIVEGHTDNVGTQKNNLILSINRSHSVAQYLKKKSNHDKFSFKGFGANKPIKSNNTKKGREKNRRVEIIIKLK